VKPHGSLYNQAAHDAVLARAIAEGVGRWNRRLILVGLAGSEALRAWQKQGFSVAADVFADRRYEPDGSLSARSHSDALITNPQEAAAQARSASEGRLRARDGSELTVDPTTICIHSDTPGALAIAREVRRALG